MTDNQVVINWHTIGILVYTGDEGIRGKILKQKN